MTKGLVGITKGQVGMNKGAGSESARTCAAASSSSNAHVQSQETVITMDDAVDEPAEGDLPHSIAVSIPATTPKK